MELLIADNFFLSNIDLGASGLSMVILFLTDLVVKLFSDFSDKEPLRNEIPNKWSKQDIRQEVPNATGVSNQIDDAEPLWHWS